MASPNVRRVLVLLIAAAASALVGCGSGGGGGSDPLLPVPVAPLITGQPAPVTVSTGQPATFSVTATGTNPQFQWRRNGTAISGATAASYSLAGATTGDSGAQFSVIVSNLAGSVTSNPAILTVTDPVVAPSLVRGPTTVSVVAGTTATFDVVAGGTAPFTYQWLKGGVVIPGAVQSSYSFAPLVADNNAEFSVSVTNAAGTILSPAVLLRVTAQFVPVSIAIQPVDVSVRAGQNATFSVTLAGTGPFTWRWFRDGVNLQLGVENTFVTTPTFVFAPALQADNGALISLEVTDSSGTVTTRQARLTVSP